MTTYMLDTDTCALIVSQRPLPLLQRMADEVAKHNKFVISAITYAEMLNTRRANENTSDYGLLIDEFVRRLDTILEWDQYAARDMFLISETLRMAKVERSSNAIAVAAHAMSADCVLITNAEYGLKNLAGLSYECWLPHPPLEKADTEQQIIDQLTLAGFSVVAGLRQLEAGLRTSNRVFAFDGHGKFFEVIKECGVITVTTIDHPPITTPKVILCQASSPST